MLTKVVIVLTTAVVSSLVANILLAVLLGGAPDLTIAVLAESIGLGAMIVVVFKLTSRLLARFG